MKTIEIVKYSVRREAQGAWRWQTPYTVRRYVARCTNAGKWVWKLDGVASRKLQIKHVPTEWFGHTVYREGGLHNLPVREIESLLPYNNDDH